MALKFLLVLVAFMVISVRGDEYEDDAVYKEEHCIKITPEKEKELQDLVLDIGKFLGDLTMKYEDIDIRYVRVDIESHSEDEVEEKEMILKVNINDCQEQGKTQNIEPNVEQPNNENGNNNGHADVDIQINNESDYVGQQVPTDNSSDHKQDQEIFEQKNVNENTNVGCKNQGDQQEKEYINANINLDNNDSQSQNQEQIQLGASVGQSNQNNQGQVQQTNDQYGGCHCMDATGLDLLRDKTDGGDNINTLLKDLDFVSAVSTSKPTVRFLNLPQNGQEMIDFLSSRRKKKIEPVWVYMMEDNNNQKEYYVFNK